jgi:phytoene dehydrogenase-like protein
MYLVCAVIMLPVASPIAPLDSSVSQVVKQSVAERWTTVSLRNGLQSLPDALLQQITENGVPVHIGQPCTRLTFDNGKAKVCLCA